MQQLRVSQKMAACVSFFCFSKKKSLSSKIHRTHPRDMQNTHTQHTAAAAQLVLFLFWEDCSIFTYNIACLEASDGVRGRILGGDPSTTALFWYTWGCNHRSSKMENSALGTECDRARNATRPVYYHFVLVSLGDKYSYF